MAPPTDKEIRSPARNTQCLRNSPDQPHHFPPLTEPPQIGDIANAVLNPGSPLTFTVPAVDADALPQTLTYALLSAPAGATLVAANGVFAWRPAVAQAGSSNFIQLRVTDDGVPRLSATQSFVVRVNPVVPPDINPPTWSNGRFGFNITGQIGPDYLVQVSSNLVNWTPLLTNTPVTVPFRLEDPEAAQHARRFYRIQLGP